MSDILSFLLSNISQETHIKIAGNSLTLREHDKMAKLKDIELTFPSVHGIFAFVMDRKSQKICASRSKKCQKTRDKCNSLNSKVCSFFTIDSHTHAGCDGIVVTRCNNEVIFYVCELKSTHAQGYIHKFKMAKALILYLCEAAQACDNITYLPKIQFILFRLFPSGRKQSLRKPSPFIPKKEDIVFLEYALPSDCKKDHRRATLSPYHGTLYGWSVGLCDNT